MQLIKTYSGYHFTYSYHEWITFKSKVIHKSNVYFQLKEPQSASRIFMFRRKLFNITGITWNREKPYLQKAIYRDSLVLPIFACEITARWCNQIGSLSETLYFFSWKLFLYNITLGRRNRLISGSRGKKEISLYFSLLLSPKREAVFLHKLARNYMSTSNRHQLFSLRVL
jgi:hypothetical protein